MPRARAAPSVVRLVRIWPLEALAHGSREYRIAVPPISRINDRLAQLILARDRSCLLAAKLPALLLLCVQLLAEAFEFGHGGLQFVFRGADETLKFSDAKPEFRHQSSVFDLGNRAAKTLDATPQLILPILDIGDVSPNQGGLVLAISNLWARCHDLRLRRENW